MAEHSSRQPSFGELFRNGNFAKFWIGQLISYLGDRIDQMAMIALASQGATKGQSGDLANQITFWATLPYVLFSLVAGPIVDRFDRRRLMIVLDLLRAAIILVLPFTLSPEHDPRVILAVVFLIGCATAIFAPAKSAFLPEIVPEDQLLRANSITSTMGTLTTLFGTILGGALVTALARLNATAVHEFPILAKLQMPLGQAAAFVIDALTYLVSAVLLWWIVVEARDRERHAWRTRQVVREGNFWAKLRDGLSFLATQRVPAVAAFMVSWFFFIGGAYFVLTTKVANLRLVNDPNEKTLVLGLAYGVLGLGLAIGGIVAGKIAHRLPLRSFVATCFVGAGVIMLGNVAPLPAKFLYLVNMAIGFAAGGVAVTMETVMQRSVPDELRGRVFALNNLLLNTLLLVSIGVGTLFLSENSSVMPALGESEERIRMWTWLMTLLAMIGGVVAFLGFPAGRTIAALHSGSDESSRCA